MLNKNIKNKPINPAYLDPSLVIENRLSGWKWYLWSTWGNRTYSHNCHDTAYTVVYVFLILCGITAIAFFYYFPLKLMGLMIFVGFNSTCILWPIGYANQSPYIIWVTVLIGAFGLVNHWQFGLGAFGYHFEPYFFSAYLIGGVLAVYRRLWNHVIWKALDKITFAYYRQHDLDFDTQTKLISDYKTAYNRLSQRFCKLLQGNSAKALTREQAQQIQTWLNNHTLVSFDKAMQWIDENSKKN